MSQMMMDPAAPGPVAPEMGPEPPMGPPGGGLPPELMAALSGGGSANSMDMIAEGPAMGMGAEEAEEPEEGEDPLSMVREAISLLRRAGDIEADDQKSAQIDKIQADLQKILAGEAQKTDKLRSALG